MFTKSAYKFTNVLVLIRYRLNTTFLYTMLVYDTIADKQCCFYTVLSPGEQQ